MTPKIIYRQYPDVVKYEIVRTNNIYLFPDLKIPRTTAQYWIKKGKHFRKLRAENFESVYKRKSEYLLQELEKEKALRVLLESVRRIFPFDFRKKFLKDKQCREQIVSAIRACLKFHKLSHCLEAIGLSKSSYQRWANEIAFCKNTKNICERRKAFQLTDLEISVMKKFVVSKKYAHISISSLHLLAQRKGELYCSIDTWYKYIRFYDWRRPWKKERRAVLRKGIRASRPNEIWHLDVTLVKIRPGYKLYIQVVIDNYSRYVLAWQITESINAENTVATLNLAKARSTEILNSSLVTNVMMDPGSENNNRQVFNYITSKNLTRTLARVDIRYSNSMIESLFRMLKNNYLYHQGIKNKEDLCRKIAFYFREHNYVIPLSGHRGGRPSEVFLSSWGDKEKSALQKEKISALQIRKQHNLKSACDICPSILTNKNNVIQC